MLSNWTGSGTSYKEKNCYAYNKDRCRIVMNYICAPDLLRYAKNDSTTELTGMFKATSNQNFDVDLGTYSTATEKMKSSTYLGMKGRIPPNLFKSVTNI